MVLSNAERQRRYREKLKAAARANTATMRGEQSADGPDELLLLFRDYYRKGAEDIAFHGREVVNDDDPPRLRAIEEFRAARPIGYFDLPDILMEAGAKAWLELYQRAAREYVASLPPRIYAPAPEPAKQKRRRRVT